MNTETKTLYELWLANATEDNLKTELEEMDETTITDSFYKDLSFGTGGLRGTIGAGTNRMNVYTVRRASQGLSDYLLSSTAATTAATSHTADTHASTAPSTTLNTGTAKAKDGRISVVIARDSRIKSDLFAKAAAGVFAANGIHVYYFDDIAPTPLLSFAVRELHATAGVVITASHNPKEYNGYKVYGSDGCQITTEAARSIQAHISAVDVFTDVRYMSSDSAFIAGNVEAEAVESVPENIYDSYLSAIKQQSVIYNESIDKNVSIVYTPLNGTGLKPITDVLSSSGYNNITVVESQSSPDGTFPTCPKPNPEERSAMEEGLTTCRTVKADLLIATDPDADRCGIAVRTTSSDYRLLSANETGLLLLDYICSQRKRHHTLPSMGVFLKTIVTNDLAEKVAASYGLETINTLTGFKFIGEQLSILEAQGRENRFVFALEESYGYLSGTYARDKDGVLAAFLIAEMFSFYHSYGITLTQRLEQIYKTFGFCLNTQHSYSFPGASGMERMNGIMSSFRSNPPRLLADQHVEKVEDYSAGIGGLPKSNVLKYYTQYSSVVIRPSGTEPKLKVYISARAISESAANDVEQAITAQIEERVKL